MASFIHGRGAGKQGNIVGYAHIFGAIGLGDERPGAVIYASRLFKAGAI